MECETMDNRYSKFTVLITTINRNIKRIKIEEMSKHNLKIQHVSCLYYLYKNDSLTSKELCDMCEEDKAAISRALKYLETEGYLVWDATNSRKKYRDPIALTDSGRETAKQVVEKVDSMLTLASVGISEEDRQVMYRCLEHIGTNLSKIVNDYKSCDITIAE